MAELETLSLDPHYSVMRHILAPQRVTTVGGGSYALRRRYARVAYQFTVSDRQRVPADAASLYSFAQRHQGDIPFWWDGLRWGMPSTPLLVGVGNDSQADFFLPNRWLLAAPMVYLDGEIADPQPTVDLVIGQLLFADPVPLDVVITALYVCRYRLVFVTQNGVALQEQAFYHDLFGYEGIQLREYITTEASLLTQDYYTATWELDAEAALAAQYDTAFAH